LNNVNDNNTLLGARQHPCIELDVWRVQHQKEENTQFLVVVVDFEILRSKKKFYKEMTTPSLDLCSWFIFSTMSSAVSLSP
jgi:hypothetical protein